MISAEAKYLEKVKEAKILVGHLKNTNEYRMRVAALALEACEIIVGGHKNAEVYSLAKFAKDIGMNHSTLHEWVRTKTIVFDRITEKQKQTFGNLTHNQIRLVKLGISKSETSNRVVQEKYQELIKQSPSISKMNNYLRNMSCILSGLKETSQRREYSVKQLRELRDFCTEILTLSKSEIARRENKEIGVC